MGPVPPLDDSVEQTVQFPSDNEENGMVNVGWRGPLAKVGNIACVLGIYPSALMCTRVLEYTGYSYDCLLWPKKKLKLIIRY